MIKNLYQCFLYIIISITFLFYIYIKLRYRFWSSQPVFHTYNLKQWILPSGIIQNKLPQKQQKFYNWKIITDNFQEISTEKKALIYYFINNNLSKNQFLSSFEKGYNRCYISLLYSHMGIPTADNTTYNTKKLHACMISKTLNGVIHKNKVKISFIHTYKIHKTSKNKHFDYEKLFYTHYINSRSIGSPHIFLFKQKGTIPWITPCTTFFSYTFDTKYINIANFNIPNNISIRQIKSGSFRMILHFFGEISKKFAFYSIPDYANLKNMISTNLITPFVLMDNNNIVGLLIFRNNNKYTSLIASACFPKYRTYLFPSLQNSLYLLKKYKNYGSVVIENISNNNYIIKEILKRKFPKEKQQISYYFYNFSIRPFMSPNCFILY